MFRHINTWNQRTRRWTRLLAAVVAWFAAPCYGHPAPRIAIQQSWEADLTGQPESRQSIFHYYAPVAIVPELIQLAVSEDAWASRLAFRVRWNNSHRGDAFGALSLEAKIRYLELLEAHWLPRAAWGSQNQSLLLQRRPNAPEWLEAHPQVRAAPGQGSALDFRHPTLRSRLSQPAWNLDQAADRNRQIYAETGLKPSHTRIQTTLPIQTLQRQARGFVAALEEINDALFPLVLAQESSWVLSERRPWDAATSNAVLRRIQDLSLSPPPGLMPEPSADAQNAYLSLDLIGSLADSVHIVLDMPTVEPAESTQRWQAAVYSLVENLRDGQLSVAAQVGKRLLDPALASQYLERVENRLGLDKGWDFARLEGELRQDKGYAWSLLFPFSRPYESDAPTTHLAEQLALLAVRAARWEGTPTVQQQWLRARVKSLYLTWAQEKLQFSQGLRFWPPTPGPSCGIERLASN